MTSHIQEKEDDNEDEPDWELATFVLLDDYSLLFIIIGLIIYSIFKMLRWIFRLIIKFYKKVKAFIT